MTKSTGRAKKQQTILIEVVDTMESDEAATQKGRARHGNISGERRRRRVAHATKTIEKSLDDMFDDLASVARNAKKEFTKAVDSPSEISVEIGIGLNAEGNLFVAKAGTNVNFKMTVTWSD